ncbi:sugar ABC transporter ATP-binding protein [Nocardioides carbamazepini]|uniref:sugar ABC transporter ATP-binding protein n=1 Tax=Nocardioides carbamazepini TaxID=2854259 RepID=UPI00214A288B|nr:sugar ABC transporter ATP-binding protein [Nocardioides carbamazepini]MCR1781915.1 sugar ABC transporter ATP-binding protein [Nocardioides carbamazepini]
MDVSFSVEPGRFHALVGGNGSGKSTLIKILAGVYSADRGGSLVVGDHDVDVERLSPRWSRDAGIRFVHQDLGLFPELTVTENVLAGSPFPRRLGGIDWAEAHRSAQRLLDGLDVAVDARSLVRDLRPADQTLVAVARCLRDREAGQVGLLVLDEPTTRLPADEVDGLLQRLRAYSAQGQSILYVTHRLDEVLTYADTVTVLRDGRHVSTRPAAGHDRASLVAAIAGHTPEDRQTQRRTSSGEVVLAVDGLSGGPLRDVSLEIRSGEVVALAGLVGSGRTSVMQNVIGAVRPRGGTVAVKGRRLRPGHVADAIARGLALVPEERVRDAAFLSLSLAENISATTVHRHRRGRWLRRADERRAAVADIETYGIKGVADDPIARLSGGNQQKAVMARAMRSSPAVLLLDEPTQGVDVGARADIYAQIDAAVAGGTGVLLATSDLDELLHLADRVLVLADGRITHQASGPEISRTWIFDHVYQHEKAST